MSTSSQSQGHPSELKLFDFANGRITDPDEEEQISQHVTGCPECRATLSQLEDDPLVAQIKKAGSGSSTSDMTEGLQRARVALGGNLTPKTPTRFGKYESIEEVGRGGFGVVWKAYDPTLSRHVALKVSRMGSLLTGKEQVRFRNEAMAVAALDHPNIIPIHEVGDVDGMSYIATAYCDGPNLADYLKQHDRLSEQMAAQLVRKLADAIDHAHQRGVLHRDLKPANVLLSSEGNSAALPFEPKVVDFGLAKLRTDDDVQSQSASGWVGTLQFMGSRAIRKRWLRRCFGCLRPWRNSLSNAHRTATV